MSKVCDICGKHTVAGRSISHSFRTVNRKFRDADYEITIHPNGAQTGVKAITLDGKPVEGTVIPYSSGKHTVEVTM